MWKLLSTLRIVSGITLKHNPSAFILGGRRFFLSEAFRCDDAWQKRYQTPIIQNIKLDEFFIDLDKKFSRDGKASAIDIDLFANAVRNESYADELQDLIHKLRMSANTTNTLPSTSHAVIRYFLDIEHYDTLLRILDDRLNYGVFPDNYCMALLLNTFLKKKMITEAARLSSIHMLQEDWSCPLVSVLALYACHLYVQNPAPWKEEIEEDTGEEVLVRVPYLRNPYFDDHFDLREPQLLIGKTLASIGATMPDAVGQTFRLIGLGMYRKWEKAIALLQLLPNSGIRPGVFRTGVEIFEEILSKELNDECDPDEKLRVTLKGLLKALDNHQLVSNDDLSSTLLSKVEQTIAKEQENIINRQQVVYAEWENLREKLLNEQIKELRRQEKIKAIEQEKKELFKKEQELFFFDNEDKIDLILEKQEQQEIADRESQKKKNVKQQDAEYIPPEVRSHIKA